MSIEQRLPQDEINIKDLHIEEPEAKSELPFDPEKEITDEDWSKIYEDTNNYRLPDLEYSYFIRFMHIKIVKSDFQVNSEDIQQIVEYLEELRKKPHRGEFFEIAEAVKILLPTKDIQLNQGDKAYLLSKIEEDESFSNMRNFWHDAATYKLLFPSDELAITPEIVHISKERLNELAQENKWGLFSEVASKMKTCGVDINKFLTPHAWKNMKDSMHDSDVVWIAANMKILAAEKVEVTDRGLELTMPKSKTDLNKPTPPLPEVKKF